MSKLDKLRQREAKKLFKFTVTPFVEVDLKTRPDAPEWMTRCFKNNRFTVMIKDNCPMQNGHTAIRAMIQKHDALPIPNHWAEMQNIKNKIFGEETMAIEYYPPQSELVDEKNIYWLFIFEEGVIPKIVK